MTFSLDTLYTQSVASSRAQREGLHTAPPTTGYGSHGTGWAIWPWKFHPHAQSVPSTRNATV